MKIQETFPYNYTIPKTLSQSIYNYLKESIINNKIKANQKINEKEIANLFQVSTTPVREAVLRLGAEGFVSLNSHREAVVKEISYKELKEISQVLGTLDSLATSLVVDYLNPEAIKELGDLTAEMERHCQINSVEKYLALNVAIHRKIWESLPNKFLQAILYYIHDQMLRYSYARFYAFRKPGVLKSSMNEHREILDTIKRKDKNRLKNLMLNHWGSFLGSSPLEDGLKEYLITNERRGMKGGENHRGSNEKKI